MAEVVSLRSRRTSEGKDGETFGRRLKRGRLGKLTEEQEVFATSIAQKSYSELTAEEKDELLGIVAVSFGLVKKG